MILPKFNYVQYLEQKDYIRHYDKLNMSFLMDTPPLKDILKELNEASGSNMSKYQLQRLLENRGILFPSQITKGDIRQKIEHLERLDIEEQYNNKLNFKQFLLKDHPPNYVPMISKYNDGWCLMVPVEDAYHACLDSLYRQNIDISIYSPHFNSLDDFKNLLAQQDIKIIDRFEKAFIKARKRIQRMTDNSLDTLSDALQISKTNIKFNRIDKIWIITGNYGTVSSEDDNAWSILVHARSPRHWSSVKKQLSFMTLDQCLGLRACT